MNRSEIADEQSNRYSNSPSDPLTSFCLVAVFAAGASLLSYLVYDFENSSSNTVSSRPEITKTHDVSKETVPATYNPN